MRYGFHSSSTAFVIENTKKKIVNIALCARSDYNIPHNNNSCNCIHTSILTPNNNNNPPKLCPYYSTVLTRLVPCLGNFQAPVPDGWGQSRQCGQRSWACLTEYRTPRARQQKPSS